MRGERKSTGRNSQYKSLHSDHVGPLFLIKQLDPDGSHLPPQHSRGHCIV